MREGEKERERRRWRRQIENWIKIIKEMETRWMENDIEKVRTYINSSVSKYYVLISVIYESIVH